MTNQFGPKGHRCFVSLVSERQFGITKECTPTERTFGPEYISLRTTMSRIVCELLLHLLRKLKLAWIWKFHLLRQLFLAVLIYMFGDYLVR